MLLRLINSVKEASNWLWAMYMMRKLDAKVLYGGCGVVITSKWLSSLRYS